MGVLGFGVGVGTLLPVHHANEPSVEKWRRAGECHVADGEPAEELSVQGNGTLTARFTVGDASFYSIELARLDNEARLKRQDKSRLQRFFMQRPAADLDRSQPSANNFEMKNCSCPAKRFRMLATPC